MYRMLCLAMLISVLGVYGQERDQAASEDRVYDLVRLATEHNGDIAAWGLRIAEARGALRQAAIRPASSIEVTGQNGRPFGSKGEAEYSALFVHPIETGGKRDQRIRLAEKSVDLAEAELAEHIRLLSAEIKFRYVDALAHSRKLEILDRLLSIDRESASLMKARAEEGEIPRLDYELMVVDLGRLEAQRISAAARADSSILELRTLLGPEQSLVLSGELPLKAISRSMQDLQEIALNRSDLRLVRILEEQAGAEALLAKAQARPDITLSAGYSYSRAQFELPTDQNTTGSALLLKDSDHGLQFGISIPLQRRDRNRGSVEAAQSSAMAAQLRKNQLKSVIRLEVQSACQKWHAASQALDVFGSTVITQAEKNLSSIRQAYELGQLRILDVLNEQRRFIESQMAYIDAKAEAAQAYYELERAIGEDLR